MPRRSPERWRSATGGSSPSARAPTVRRLVGDGTRVIDAGGRTVIPGLIDSHVHALGVAAAEDGTAVPEPQVDCRDAGVDPPRRVGRAGGRLDLDSARLPDANPRAAVPDARGARCCGTQSPGGRRRRLRADGQQRGASRSVDRRQHAESSGRRHRQGRRWPPDRPAAECGRAARRNSVARPTTTSRRSTRSSACTRPTTASASRASASAAPAWLDSAPMRRLRKASRLHVRATVTIRIPNPQDPTSVEAFFRDLPLKPRQGDEWLKAGPLKIIADGGILAGTSFMREPYGLRARALYGVGDPAYRGFLTITREQIAAAIEAGASRGWQMAAHVTGDAGVDAVLDAFEAAQRRHPSADPRHTLIHAYFVERRDRGESGPAGRPGRYPARVVLQGRRRARSRAGRRPARAVHRPPHVARRRGGDGHQHRSHVRARPGQRDEPVQPVPDDGHGGEPPNRGRPGDWPGPARLADGGPADDDSRPPLDSASTSVARASIEVGKLGDLAILSDDLLTCPEDRIKLHHRGTHDGRRSGGARRRRQRRSSRNDLDLTRCRPGQPGRLRGNRCGLARRDLGAADAAAALRHRLAPALARDAGLHRHARAHVPAAQRDGLRADAARGARGRQAGGGAASGRGDPLRARQRRRSGGALPRGTICRGGLQGHQDAQAQVQLGRLRILPDLSAAAGARAGRPVPYRHRRRQRVGRAGAVVDGADAPIVSSHHRQVLSEAPHPGGASRQPVVRRSGRGRAVVEKRALRSDRLVAHQERAQSGRVQGVPVVGWTHGAQLAGCRVRVREAGLRHRRAARRARQHAGPVRGHAERLRCARGQPAEDLRRDHGRDSGDPGARAHGEPPMPNSRTPPTLHVEERR